jgi:hypothetical protein
MVGDLGFFFQQRQWFEFVKNLFLVQLIALADDDFFSDDAVLRSAGKGLRYNLVSAEQVRVLPLPGTPHELARSIVRESNDMPGIRVDSCPLAVNDFEPLTLLMFAK